jgi:hypothetical protein
MEVAELVILQECEHSHDHIWHDYFAMSPIYDNRFIKCHYKMLLIFFLQIMILTFSKNVMLVVF